MKIESNLNDGVLTVSLAGRLDTTTAPALGSFLTEHYDGIHMLIMDCEQLSYLSSAGLRVLLMAQKKMKGDMKLTKVCELVMEVFEMTGFADILQIES